MKKHIILPITLAAMMMLGGCGKSSTPASSNTGSDTTDTNTGSDVVVNSVSITNKEALQASWFAGESSRKIAITADPAIEDLNDALDDGSLTITSSDTAVVSVARLMLSPVAAGTATVTVAYGGKSDTVEITVSAERTAKDKYGTAHAGTADDPFDNADAVKASPLAVAASDTTKYYIKGTVLSFYHAVGERSDGCVSWYFNDGNDAKGFEAYKILKEDGTSLTNDDIWVGAEVVIKGALTVYNSQAETDTGIWVENTGNGAEKPAAKQTIEATVAEAVTAGLAEEDGASTYDDYKVTGYVTTVEGTNYWIDDTKGSTADKTAQVELYLAYFSGKILDNTGAETTLTKGAKIQVTMTLKNYHGQVENGVINGDITVLEAGEEPVVGPTEPTVVTAPVVGTEYVAGIFNAASSTELLATGLDSSGYVTTSTNKYEAATIVVGGEADAYTLQIKDGQYLNIVSYTNSSGTTKYKCELSDTAVTYKFDTVANTFIATIDSVDVYIGSYSSSKYTTLSVSNTSYLYSDDTKTAVKDGQYPMHLYLADDVDAVEPEVATSVATDKYYHAGVNRSAKKDQLYVTGVSGNYLTTENLDTNAVNFIFEEVEGGYNLKNKDTGKYLNVDFQSGSTSKFMPVESDTAASVWTFDTVSNTVITTLTSGDTSVSVYLGSYSSSKYTTLSVSNTSYLYSDDAKTAVKDGQYPLHFYEAGTYSTVAYESESQSFTAFTEAQATAKEASYEGTSYTLSIAQNSASSAFNTSSTDGIRIYVGYSFAIAPKEGYSIGYVEMTCTSDSYATATSSSTLNDGASASINGSVVTITAGTDGTVSYASVGKQFRVASITVYYLAK